MTGAGRWGKVPVTSDLTAQGGVLSGGILRAAQARGLSLARQVFIGALMTAVILLLIAPPKNSERRAEHAVQPW
ncbi:hypothetical protein ACIPUC_14785 [Streptomyces sp. LARHCF249]